MSFRSPPTPTTTVPKSFEAQTPAVRVEIYVTNRRVTKIENSTEIFEKYRNARKIERIYVGRDKYAQASQIQSTLG